jgi:protein-S-isoprenylcysteine O-methyltransferase Ste14
MVFISLLKKAVFHQLLNVYFFPSSPFIQGSGVLVCASGIAFAIWARIHIGKNWGMPMSLKEKPEMVTTGPYRFIRHPIYTGLCSAMIGSVITDGFLWLIYFVVLGGYFIYSAKKEEKSMLFQFPDKYPAYMKRTRMLIPFIF